MTRDERLKFCRICTKRKPDLKKGLLCSITNEYADFEGTCSDFFEDELEKNRKLNMELAAAGRDDVGDARDAKKNKQVGLIWLFSGLIIFVLTISVFDGMVIILPFGAIIYGARQYYKGTEQEKILANHSKFNDELKRKNGSNS